jgi:hypothetical protein
MQRLRYWAATVAMTSIPVGCAPTINVSSHVERGLDLSRYRTFDWGPPDALPTGDARLDENPFFKDRLEGAVERELARRGIEFPSAASPDLLIHYHASIVERIDVNKADRTYGYCTAGDCPPDTVTYEVGSIVLDIIDAKTNRLIWRGWAQSRVQELLDDPDRMAQTVREAVERMFERLP